MPDRDFISDIGHFRVGLSRDADGRQYGFSNDLLPEIWDVLLGQRDGTVTDSIESLKEQYEAGSGKKSGALMCHVYASTDEYVKWLEVRCEWFEREYKRICENFVRTK